MSEVTATYVTQQRVKYRFITGWAGKQILQVGNICQDWGTNTGHDTGPKYVHWRNATRWEAEEFLRGGTKYSQ